MRYFADFHAAYGIRDMYAGGFYPFATPEEYWAWWSRHIMVNRYDAPTGRPYHDLLNLLDGRDFFVLTTNVDHQFQAGGHRPGAAVLSAGRLRAVAVLEACHRGTYDNEAAVRHLAAEQRNMRVPSSCCALPGVRRADGHEPAHRRDVRRGRRLACGPRALRGVRGGAAGDRLLLLELGVGGNTPGIVKYPFWRMAARNPRAFYACVNRGEAYAPRELGARALALDADIGAVLRDLCMLPGRGSRGR